MPVPMVVQYAVLVAGIWGVVVVYMLSVLNRRGRSSPPANRTVRWLDLAFFVSAGGMIVLAGIRLFGGAFTDRDSWWLLLLVFLVCGDLRFTAVVVRTLCAPSIQSGQSRDGS